MLQTIISGGQTGADRAALDAALETGFPCCGWCPKNRQAEDGPIPGRYPLKELDGGYRDRTLANVRDSDATVIFYHGQISGGTKLTLGFCVRVQRPYIEIDSSLMSADHAAPAIAGFILENDIHKLNIAGPRASGHPGIYRYVKAVVRQLITAQGDYIAP